MDSTAWAAPLAGQTILVVEDDAFISLNTGTTLVEAGAVVIRATDQLSGLAAAGDDRLTAAVLDVRLGKDPVDPICAALDGRWVPFLFLTAYTGASVEKWSPAPILPKPVVGQALIDGVVNILVTGRDAIDLTNKARLDRIILRAQIRLARQERCAGQLAGKGQDTRSANSLLRIMGESVILLQAHRHTLSEDDAVRH
jgi:CheY-like chemotaxis protein